VLCSIRAGIGKDVEVSVELQENSVKRASTVTQVFSYDVARIDSWIFFQWSPAYPYNHPPATGRNSISVLGINFGTSIYSDSGRLGNTASEATEWVSDSTLKLRFAAGVGAALYFGVTTPSGVGANNRGFSYGKPVITRRHIDAGTALVGPANSPLSGNSTTTISGFNFGTVDYTGQAKLGGTAINKVLTNWQSDTMIAIRTPPGACVGVDVSLTVAQQVDTHTKAWSYDAPEFSSPPGAAVNGSAINSPTTGGKTVTVLGINMGAWDLTGQGKYGGTSGEATKWTSDSSVAFKSPSGFAAGHTAAFSVCGQSASVRKQLSYDVPTVTDQSPSNGPSAGGGTITLFGNNFGTLDFTGRASVGTHSNQSLVYLDGDGGLVAYNVTGATACESTRWLSETSARCKVSAGAGVQYGVAFTVGQNIGTQQTGHFFSYDIPVMTGAFPANGPAYGGENVTLRFGGPLTTYSITMLGRDFGRVDYTPKARLGDTDCMAAKWLSSSSLVCKIPGGGCKDVSIAVSVLGYNNGTQYGVATKQFSYDAPALSTIDAGNNTGPTSGGADFQINGKNFGPGIQSIVYRIGSTSMNETTWISDTFVKGKVPAGVGKALTLAISVCGSHGALSRVYSYSAPNVTGAAGGEVNQLFFTGTRTGGAMDPAPSVPLVVQTGGSTVSVTGAYFGQADYSARVRFASTAGIRTNWTSDTAIEAVNPSGACANHHLVATVGVQTGTLEDAFCYDIPFVTAGTSKWLNRPTTGGQSISLLGVNFGTAHYSPAGRVIWTELKSEWTSTTPDGLKNYTGTACMGTGWISFSSVSCKYPQGIYPNHVVRFTICGEGTNNNETTFSYDEPKITQIHFGNSPASGQVSMHVTGFNFGTADYSAQMFVGHTKSKVYDATNASQTQFMAINWYSDSSLYAKTPPGLGLELGIILFHNVSDRLAGTLQGLYSYDRPTISSRAQANSPAIGAINITITGANYGMQDWAAPPLSSSQIQGLLRAGGTASDSTYWVSDSSLLGLLSPGVCPFRPLAVSVMTLVGTASGGFSFDKPVIYWNDTSKMFSGPLVDNGDGATFTPNAPAAGNQNATIGGVNFGKNDYTVKARIGATSLLLMQWSSDTAVVGLVAPGVCRSLNTSMVVCNQVATSSKVFSYNRPQVDMNGTNTPTTGKQVLVLNGLNYGANSYSPSVRLGVSSGQATHWTSDTVVRVQVAAGITQPLVMVSTVCEQVGTQQATNSYFSYDGPQTSSMNGNGPSTGGTFLTVAGSDFGTARYTGGARIGNGNQNNTVFGATAAQATGWRSDSAITAKLPAGVSHLLGVTFTVGLQLGTSSAHFTFDAPKPSAVKLANGPSSGTTSMTISGSNFGTADYSGNSAIGDTSAETSVWGSTTSVIAKLAAGVSVGHEVVVTVGDTILDAKAQAPMGVIIDHRAYRTTESLFSYDAPAVTSTLSYELKTMGQETLTVRGGSFATWANSAQARLGHSAAEAMNWNSDSQLTLKVPAGCGKDKSVAVTSQLRTGSLSKAVTYQVPTLSSVAAPNLATAGGFRFISVSGSNFVQYETSSRSSVGKTAAIRTLWASDTTVRSSPNAGSCSELEVVVTVCNQVNTLSRAVSYDKPALRAISGTNSPKTGGLTSTVSGANFATVDISGSFRFESAAESTRWKSDSSVMARAPAGHDGMLQIVFTACHGMSTLTGAFTFDSPVITKGHPTNGPALATTLTAYGLNFAKADYSAKTRIGGSAVGTTAWTSDSAVASFAHSGVGGSHDMVFTIAKQFNSLKTVFTFDDPVITNVLGTNGMATGGTDISIYGVNFGKWDNSATAKVGGSACTSTRWVSNSHMICKAPAGLCHNKDISIEYANGKRGLYSEVFDYNGPTVTVASLGNGPASGKNDVTVMGSNFGTAEYSQRVSVVGGGYVIPSQTTWLADDTLLAKMPAGGGINMALTAEVCQLRSTLAIAYCYDVPSVSAINSQSANRWDPMTMSNSPQTGGSTTTVYGQNFGAFDLSLVSSIGGTKTLMSRWISDSSLIIRVPPGVEQGGAVDVYLKEAGHKMASLTLSFSFDTPVITSVSPAPAEAQSTITISGTNMGAWDTSPAVTIGGTVCEAVSWASWSSVLCKTPAGVGGVHDVEVVVAGQGASLVDALTYGPPRVRSAQLPNGPLSGGTRVTVFGTGFGGSDTSPNAKFGGTQCITTTWRSATSLTCTLSAGIGRAAVTVEESSTGTVYTGSKSDAFFYDSPKPTSVLARNAPGTGGVTLSIMGSNFGSYVPASPADALKARLGNNPCRTTTWTSDTAASCVAPDGIGVAPLTLDLAGSVGRLEEAVIYDGFYVKSISPRNSPTAGGSSLTVTGVMLGTQDSLPKVEFGAKSGTVKWISPTSVIVETPAHVKEWLGTSVTVTVDRAQLFQNYFSYDGVIITSVKPHFGSTMHVPSSTIYFVRPSLCVLCTRKCFVDECETNDCISRLRLQVVGCL